jgi:DNA-binding Xre family transcriptional regulator
MDYERLEEILAKRGMNAVDLSRLTGIPPTTISGWVRLKHLITGD